MVFKFLTFITRFNTLPTESVQLQFYSSFQNTCKTGTHARAPALMYVYRRTLSKFALERLNNDLFLMTIIQNNYMHNS